jgi:hypothetical protein
VAQIDQVPRFPSASKRSFWISDWRSEKVNFAANAEPKLPTAKGSMRCHAHKRFDTHAAPKYI